MNRLFAGLIFSIVSTLAHAGAEGTKITIHEVSVAVESSIVGGGPMSSVGMARKTVNPAPVALVLKEEQPSGRGPAPLGTIYSDKKVFNVQVDRVDFEVSVEASAQVFEGQETYSANVLLRRKGEKRWEHVAGVTTKSAASLQEVVSVSGRARDTFWINKANKEAGRAEVTLNVADFDWI